MLHSYVPDLLSLIPLTWVFYFLWKQRKEFRSLWPFLLGAGFLISGRLIDIILEHPVIHLFFSKKLPANIFEYPMIMGSDFADICAVIFLILGFTRTIDFMRSGKRKIESYESLLPICAACKKIKSDEGVWEPVESYLYDRGAPPLTHSLCPVCAEKMREEIARESKQTK